MSVARPPSRNAFLGDPSQDISPHENSFRSFLRIEFDRVLQNVVAEHTTRLSDALVGTTSARHSVVEVVESDLEQPDLPGVLDLESYEVPSGLPSQQRQVAQTLLVQPQESRGGSKCSNRKPSSGLPAICEKVASIKTGVPGAFSEISSFVKSHSLELPETREKRGGSKTSAASCEEVDAWADSEDQPSDLPTIPTPTNQESGALESAEKHTFTVLDTWANLNLSVGGWAQPVSVASSGRLKSSFTGHDLGVHRFESTDATASLVGDTEPAKGLRRCTMAPNSRKHVAWNFACFLLITADVIFIPSQVFRSHTSYLYDSVAAWVARLAICLFWTLDVPFTFLIGYISDHGTVVLSLPMIARRYIQRRFPVDLSLLVCMYVAVIMDLSDKPSGRHSTAATVGGVLKVLQMLRIHRAPAVWSICGQVLFFRSEGRLLVVYVIAIICALLLLIHILGCLWCWISKDAWWNPEPGPLNTWDTYAQSIHVVLALFVGEHVVMPETFVQRSFFIILLFSGFIICSAFVGSLATAMSRLLVLARQRSSKFAALSAFLSEHSISTDLTIRINRNAHHTLDHRKVHIQEAEVELLQVISEPLRAELHYEIFSHHVLEHPFFYFLNQTRPTTVRSMCHSAVHIIKVSNGDRLFTDHEIPQKPSMYFCIYGKLQYLCPDEFPRAIEPKQWVAEATLWTSWAHRGTLTATEEGEILAVDRKRFIRVMNKITLANAKIYAEKFVRHLNDQEEDYPTTDIGPPAQELRMMAYKTFRDQGEDIEAPPDWQLPNLRETRNFSVVELPSFLASAFHLQRGSVASVKSTLTRQSSRLTGIHFNGVTNTR